jgi:3-hydroxymyristoyl/3-hydroxydecanoyl-(acyl carrier protein) dehydratase
MVKRENSELKNKTIRIMMDASVLNSDQISKIIDITPPFQMITEAISFDEENKIEGIQEMKNLDWCLKSHFVRKPVMPASLLVEGMLQTMVLLIYRKFDHGENYSYISNINFKIFKSVAGLGKIKHVAELTNFKRGIFKGIIKTYNDVEIIAECEVIYASPFLFYKKI